MTSSADTKSDDRRFYEPEVCDERRRRIRISLAALAYERYDSPIISDGEFDALCHAIIPTMETGHEKIDAFFRTVFSPSTGSWIHRHPEIERINNLLRREWPEQFGSK